LRWRARWPRGKGGGVGVSPVSFPICRHFRRLMIALTVPVSAECEPDKSNRHQDGSGYHQPMRIFHLSIPNSRSVSLLEYSRSFDRIKGLWNVPRFSSSILARSPIDSRSAFSSSLLLLFGSRVRSGPSLFRGSLIFARPLLCPSWSPWGCRESCWSAQTLARSRPGDLAICVGSSGVYSAN
jgi:hypothetical protein